ncbi:polymeric immunoglobulin receptor-like isoform X2 [Salminus brasiliensis]|uniref:polymeric immunoglobulin receptor-like isoform X2 n=1 Tax=Salminus brasiliensis TaxID=930266 RepID=UPI003B82EC34
MFVSYHLDHLELRKMISLLRIISLFQVLTFVATNNKPKDTYVGVEGSTLNIYCDYPDGYQDYIKYFCRDPCTYDDYLIQSEGSGTNISKERYTGLDSVSKLVFIVIIKNIAMEDAGVYYCGVEKSGHDILNKVKVFVSGDLTYVAVNERSRDTYVGTKGSTLNIYCDYPDGYQDYIKYFCRDPCTYDDFLIQSDTSGTNISKERYTGLDSVSKLVFIVTIKTLIVEDFGVYYCGVEKSGHDILNKVKVFISGVTMNNKLEDSYLGMEGASVDICCHYPDGYQDYIKYFCRNPCKDDDDILIKSESSNSTIRYTGLDNVTEQNFIVTIRNLVKEDSGVYYCGVEMSGHDILDKVNVFVSRETPSVFCIQT